MSLKRKLFASGFLFLSERNWKCIDGGDETHDAQEIWILNSIIHKIPAGSQPKPTRIKTISCELGPNHWTIQKSTNYWWDRIVVVIALKILKNIRNRLISCSENEVWNYIEPSEYFLVFLSTITHSVWHWSVSFGVFLYNICLSFWHLYYLNFTYPLQYFVDFLFTESKYVAFTIAQEFSIFFVVVETNLFRPFFVIPFVFDLWSGQFLCKMCLNVFTLIPFSLPLQVSFFSTSPELSNKQRFEYFSRTIPSDHYQVKAMVDIVRRMGWSYVSIIYEESNYGIKVSPYTR